MRRLNKNETRLLIILSGAFLLLGSLLLLRIGLKSAAEERERIALLKTQYEGYLRLRQQAAYWEARRKWMDKNPLPQYDAARSDSDFVERIQKGLIAAGLRIEEQQLKETRQKDAFFIAVLSLKITGNLETFIRWLVATQRAGNYLAISKLNLKADSSAMVATVELSQFFCR